MEARSESKANWALRSRPESQDAWKSPDAEMLESTDSIDEQEDTCTTPKSAMRGGLRLSQYEADDEARLPPVYLTTPHGTWHSVVAAAEIMKFARHHQLDLVYILHLYQDTSQKLPMSKFNPHSARGIPFTGLMLAAYGLENTSLPLQLPMHVRVLQQEDAEYRYQSHATCPREVTDGQMYTFRKSHQQSIEPNQKTQRGVLFGAFRKEANGGGRGRPISRKTAGIFVDFLVDIYLTNGLQSLVLDRPPAAAQGLGITWDLGSPDTSGISSSWTRPTPAQRVLDPNRPTRP